MLVALALASLTSVCQVPKLAMDTFANDLLQLPTEPYSTESAHSGFPLGLVEFFAPWCPHCRYFAPHVERLGRTFNTGEGSPRSPINLYKVDCVDQKPLCKYFNITRYPTVLWAPIRAWQKESPVPKGNMTRGVFTKIEHKWTTSSPMIFFLMIYFIVGIINSGSDLNPEGHLDVIVLSLV